MIERTFMLRRRRGIPFSGSVGHLLSLWLLVLLGVNTVTLGCGSTPDDETARAQPDEGDDAEGDDGDDEESEDQESDDVPAPDGADVDEGGASDGSSGASVPDEESIASLCDRLCEAWADCEEVGGADCLDECRGATEGSIEIGCYPQVQAIYDCVLASGECPEQAPCDAEGTAYAGCTTGAEDSTGGMSPMVGGGTATSGSASSGGEVPSDPSDVPPAEADPAESEVDPTEHFGGEDSTPEAILEAADIAQCSEFEVGEFDCGGTGTSWGGSQCTVECYDPDDRIWNSVCRDGLCRCQYDGITYCQCAHEGMSENGCNSCCPQLTDADLEF